MLAGLGRLLLGFVLALLISVNVSHGLDNGFEIHSTMAAPDPDLEIVVLDGGGVPLNGADVQVNGTMDFKTGSTGSVLVVNASGASPQTVKVVYRGVKVFEAELAPDPNFRREIRASVYDWVLMVYDSQRRDLVEGAALSISHTQSSLASFSEKTDIEGRLQVNDLPGGLYTVTVSFWGKKVNETTLLLDSQLKTSEILASLYRFLVRLVDVNGNPTPDVEVRLWNTTDTTRRYLSERSNSSGVAVFKTLTGVTDYVMEAWFKGDKILTDNVALQSGDADRVSFTGLLYLRMEVRDWKNQTVIRDPNYNTTGDLYRDSSLYSTSRSTEGLMYFGHVVAGTFRVVLKVEEITVLDQTMSFDASKQNSSLRAMFYDITLRADSRELANESQVSNLVVQISFGLSLRIEQKLDSKGEVVVPDLPPATINYVLSTSYQEVGRGSVNVEKDDDFKLLKVLAYSLTIYFLNGDGEGIQSNYTIVSSGMPIFEGVSEASGKSVPGKLLRLTYEIRAWYLGVQTLSQIVELDSDKLETFRTRVYTLIVSLRDYDHENPIGGAEITVKSKVLLIRNTTNADGLAVFKNLPGDVYNVSASLYGLEVGNTPTFSLARTHEESIPLPRIFDLDLRVSDAEGNPLESGLATVMIEGVAVRTREVTKGLALIQDIPAGRIKLAVSLYGLEVVSSDHELQADDQRFSLLARVHSLKATALRDDSGPLSGASVSLVQAGKVITSRLLGDDGEALLNLPEGNYEIVVRFQDTEVAREKFSLNISDKIVVRTAVFKIRINVWNLRGTSVGPALLQVTREHRNVLPNMSSLTGQFSFYLAGGNYSAMLSLLGRTHVATLKSRGGVTLNILHLIEKEDNRLVVLGAASFPSLGVVVALAAKHKRKKPVGRPVEPKVKPGVPRI